MMCSCGVDLSTEMSVSREFVTKDSNKAVLGYGHYNAGEFVADSVDVEGELLAIGGKDKCTDCEAKCLL